MNIFRFVTSLLNIPLSDSPIPLAPHLAREWNCWQESDDSAEEDEITLRSVAQCHLKIAPVSWGLCHLCL